MRNGRFSVRITEAGGKRRHLGVFETRPEAEGALRAALLMLADGDAAPTGVVTLSVIADSFLAKRERAGARNIRTDRNRWKNHVADSPLASAAMANVRAGDIHDWVEHLRSKDAGSPSTSTKGAKKMSRQTAVHCLNLVRAAFDFALRRGIVHANPAREVKLERSGTTHEPWTYLLPEESERLLRCPAIPEHDRLVMAFAIGTGLRQGEQWNLELADLKVDDAQPHVVVRFGKKNQPPKNGKIRRVPLVGLALLAARRWLELLPTLAPHNPEGLAFPTPATHVAGKRRYRGGGRRGDGKPIKGWRDFLKAAGLDDPSKRHDGQRVRWHDLRHTCASSLVAGWWGHAWRLEEVCKLLGHSSIIVTQRYAHLAESEIHRVARLTGGGPGGGPGGGFQALDTDGIKYAQVADITTHSGDLLSRKSQVRVLPGVPAESLPNSAGDAAARIQRVSNPGRPWKASPGPLPAAASAPVPTWLEETQIAAAALRVSWDALEEAVDAIAPPSSRSRAGGRS